MKIQLTITLFLVFIGLYSGICADGNVQATQRLQPSDLVYMGAFRMPDGVPGSDVKSWGWGGFAMTHYPNGDPSGPDDNYPGSLFGTGHAWEHQISEFSIPVPVISGSKNLDQLNKAATLQPFQDIVGVSTLEMPRVGLAYLPAQGSQSSGKIHYCRGYHLMDEGTFLSHGWFETNLSNPQAQGRWYLNTTNGIYNTNDYIFDAPASWAATNTSGRHLITGRYRDGGWSGMGPTLYAIAPWNDGNPPANNTALSFTTLLKYTSSADYAETEYTMTNYHHSDEWSGASWITSGSKAAVVFVGTKGTGDCWYGDSEGPCTECAGERGWWSTGFEGQFVFYDPNDLANVANGSMEPWEPQPYATLNVDQYLYHIQSTQQWYHMGAACFDRTNGYFYVFEPYVDDDKPIVHVWKVETSTTTLTAEISLNRSRLNFGGSTTGNTNGPQTFTITNSGTGSMNWTVSDNAGWLNCSPTSGNQSGVVTVSVDISGLSAGSYTGTITVTSAEATNSPETVTVALNVFNTGGDSFPFGSFDTPLDDATVRGSVAVTGWALDDVGIDDVVIYRNPVSGESPGWKEIGRALFVEGARTDIEAKYNTYPDNYKAGWGYMMLTNFLPDQGNGTFTLYAVAVDNAGNTVILDSKTMTCDNANAVKPFGAIESPDQGGTASGSSYRNWGWVLTPPPNTIPTDGSTIQVQIDGVTVGNPVYDLYRGDVAEMFPGYENSDGAFGYFDIDTTAYENGVHIIQWVATDDDGNTDGIGSRYFTVQNTGNRQQAIGNSRGAPMWAPKHAPPPTTSSLIHKNKSHHFEITQLERIAIPLGPGIRGTLRPLPIGSTLDMENGMFYWTPGPGFLGKHELEFLTNSGETRKISITIKPKY